MKGTVKKLEDETFIVVYFLECAEDENEVIPVACKLMPGFEYFKDGDSIEFELYNFAQEDGSFSSYAKPHLTLTPHISQVISEKYEEDKTLGRKFEELYQGFINGDFVATDLLKEDCIEIAD